MAKTMIDQMVDRFLAWPMPKNFAPDCGIQFTPIDHPHCWPVGTNLMTAEQAKCMVRHMLAGVVPPERYTTEEEGEAYMRGYFDSENAKTAND